MSKQFEDRPYPDEVVGTKYIVTNPINSTGYSYSDIIELIDNGGRYIPYFRTKRGEKVLAHWHELSPYEEPTESQGKPVQDTSDYDQLSLENHNLKQDIKKLEDYILRTARG